MESTNENKLTVEEYVRFVRIKEEIQQILERSNIKESLLHAEESIKGLTIDLTVKCSITRKKD